MTEEQDKNNNDDDFVSETATTGPPEQTQRHQSVVRIAAAAAIAVPALAALAIVFVFSAGNNTEQAFAPPPAPCAECGTVINGTGEGTITIPENKKAEIPPPTCFACEAQISFEAFEDDLKGTSGTITITYIDEEGVAQTIQDNDVSSLKVSGDKFKFVLRGAAEFPGPSCVLCTTINYVLVGEVTDKETGEATMVFKADGGIKGNFDGDDVTISIIGPA